MDLAKKGKLHQKVLIDRTVNMCKKQSDFVKNRA